MPKKQSLVSVIVPVYNGARFLAAALESIVAQDYRPLEIIVVDDGSTDDSAHLAQSFSEVRYFYQLNQGNACARNLGLELARGEYIAFLDQDDLWTPHKLRLQVAYLERHPGTGYVLGKMEILPEPGAAVHRLLKPQMLAKEHVSWLLGALLARKDIFEQIGGFDQKYNIAHDTDWILRAKDAGIQSAVLPQVLLYWRVHEANQSYEQVQIRSEMLRVLKASMDRRQGHPRREN